MTVSILRPSSLRLASQALFLAIFVSILPVSVQAQTMDTRALLDRINRLERDIRTLNSQIATVPTSVPTSMPTSMPTSLVAPQKGVVVNVGGENPTDRLMSRVAGLEEEVRNATGLAESMAHNIDLANARLDKLVVDLDYRLARLEGTAPGSLKASQDSVNMPNVSAAPATHAVSNAGSMAPPTDAAPAYTVPNAGGGQGVLGTLPKSTLDKIVAEGDEISAAKTEAAPQQTAALTPAEAPIPVKETVSAQDQYKNALNLTRQARYQEAELAFKAFIEANGQDPLAGNANYWLGETYYVRKNFMQAAQVFFQSYKSYPKGAKAADSLLKLGMSMAAMEKTSEACTTFGKLKKEFGANLKSNIVRALKKETKRLACK